MSYFKHFFAKLDSDYTDLFNFAEHRHEALVVDVFLQLPQLRQLSGELVTDFLQHDSCQSSLVCNNNNTHTHTRLTALCPGLPR